MNSKQNQKQNQATTVPQIDQEAAMKAIADIRQAVPFVKDLTPQDRKTIAKISTKGRAFVHKAVAVAEQNPQILPSFVTLEEMRANSLLLDSLTTVLIAVDQLRKQLSDTAIFVGGEAYSSARSVYLYAAAAGPALETAVDELSQYFARKGNGAARPSVPDPQQATTVTQT